MGSIYPALNYHRLSILPWLVYKFQHPKHNLPKLHRDLNPRYRPMSFSQNSKRGLLVFQHSSRNATERLEATLIDEIVSSHKCICPAWFSLCRHCLLNLLHLLDLVHLLPSLLLAEDSPTHLQHCLKAFFSFPGILRESTDTGLLD